MILCRYTLLGPLAAKALSQHTTLDLARLPFMSGADASVAGVPCRVTRCGYTGEDGFEVRKYEMWLQYCSIFRFFPLALSDLSQRLPTSHQYRSQFQRQKVLGYVKRCWATRM